MSQHTEGTRRRGMALVEAGRYELAIPILRDALASAPHDAQLLNHLSYALMRTGVAGEALQMANAGLGVEPTSEWGHRLRALALKHLGRYKQALESAREAQRLAPDQWIAHSTVAEMLMLLGRLPEAEVASREAIRLAPNISGPHTMLALVLLERQQLVEARTCAHQALRIEPGSATARNVLGVLDRLGKGEQSAREHFVAAASSDLRFTAARTNLADSVLRGGVHEIAVWRMLVQPITLGIGLGAFGVVGLIAAFFALASVRVLLAEVRMRKISSLTRSYIRQRARERWRPSLLFETLRPRPLMQAITAGFRRNLVGQFIGFWSIVGVVFVCGWAIGRSLQ